MTRLLQAAGFILFTKSSPTQFLLMQHVDRWDLPKGHAEESEDLLTTALRETEEETGIKSAAIVVDHDFHYAVEYPVDGKKRGSYLKRVTYFLGFVERPCDPVLTEHIGFKWFDWQANNSIQVQTIDPLLSAVRDYLDRPGK